MRFPFSPLAILIVAFLTSLLLRGNVWNGEGIDESYYYSQISSAVFDGDVDYANDFLNSRNSYEVRTALANRIFRNGRIDQPFPCGMAVLSAPAFVAVRLADIASGGALAGNDRFTYPYRAAISFTTWMMVLLGIIACQRVGARFTTERGSALLTAALFFGTNLCYYTWNDSAMAHGASFGVCALALLAAIRYGEVPSRRRAILWGLLLGLAFLVRWQDFIVVILAPVIFAGARDRRGYSSRDLVACGLVVLVVALPQFILWKKFFGSYLAIPQGGDFFRLTWWRPLAVMFSPLNGWIFTHPVVALFVAGFATSLRRRAPLVVGCLIIVLVAIFVNSLAGDWWAGGSFGNRRFISVLPFLMPAAAMALSRASRVGKSFALFFSGACCGVNFLLVARFTQSAPRPVFWGSFAARAGDYLGYCFGSRDALFSSDLFCQPMAVDHRGAVIAIFLSMIVLVGCAALGFRSAAVRRARLARLAVALVLANSLVVSAVFANSGYAERELAKSWNEKISADFAAEDFKAMRATAAETIPLPLAGRLSGLEDAIIGKRWEEAKTLSASLYAVTPRTVADAWQRYTPAQRQQREVWLAGAVDIRDPSREFLQRMAAEHALTRDTESAKATRDRLKGPDWWREWMRFREDFESGAGAKSLRARLDGVVRVNPFFSSAVMELIRLEREDDNVDALVSTHRINLREAMELADYIHEHYAGNESAFQHVWGNAANENFQYLEWMTMARHATEPLARARDLGLRKQDVEYWSQRLEESAAYEEHLLKNSPPQVATVGRFSTFEFPGDTIARATPDFLRDALGWGGLEINDETGESWRWSMAPNVFVMLDHSIPAGRYTIRCRGRRMGDASRQPRLKFDFYGEPSQQRASMYDEFFDLSIPLTTARNLHAPMLRINHATFPIGDFFPGSEDNRRVGMILYQVWVEPQHVAVSE